MENAEMQSWTRMAWAAMVCVLCAATLWPFAGIACWAVIIAVACEPLAIKASRRLRSDWAGAIAVGLVLALVVVLPLALSAIQAATQVQLAMEWGKELSQAPWPFAPDWMSHVPMVGGYLIKVWDYAGDEGMNQAEAWGTLHAASAASLVAIFAGEAGSLAGKAVASLFAATVLMGLRQKASQGVHKMGARAIGESSAQWIALAASAIRGVAVGVCGTALTLSVCVAIGLAVAGIPAVSLLACLAMALCVAQIGPIPILAPCSLYLAIEGHYGAAIGLGVLAVVLSVLDGVMRPYLIGRELKMPMAWIFAGVIGGLLSMGMAGLFLGPMFLAMGLKLWEDWMSRS